MNKSWSRIDLAHALKVGGALLGCVLGAQALARVGALRFGGLEAAELLVGIATVLMVRGPYRLAVVSFTLVAAAIIGIARTLNVVVHAFTAGEGLPSISGGYFFRAFVYGTYLLGYWWVNRLGEAAQKKREGTQGLHAEGD